MGESSQSNLFESWIGTSSQLFATMLRANQAVLTPMPPDGENECDEGREAARERVEAAETLSEWDADPPATGSGSLTVGDRVEFSKTISEADVRSFAAASGDTNPLHLDDEYAETTRFRGRIAHGTLVGGLISAALARLPGLVVYLSQDLEFHNPVRIGDRLTAECEIVEDLGHDQYRLTTTVVDGDETAVDGEAVVLIDDSEGD